MSTFINIWSTVRQYENRKKSDRFGACFLILFMFPLHPVRRVYVHIVSDFGRFSRNVCDHCPRFPHGRCADVGVYEHRKDRVVFVYILFRVDSGRGVTGRCRFCHLGGTRRLRVAAMVHACYPAKTFVIKPRVRATHKLPEIQCSPATSNYLIRWSLSRNVRTPF